MADWAIERSMAVAAVDEHSRHDAWVVEEDTGQDVCWEMSAKDQHEHNRHCSVQEVGEDKMSKCYCKEQLDLVDLSRALFVVVVRHSEMASEQEADSNLKVEQGVQMATKEKAPWL